MLFTLFLYTIHTIQFFYIKFIFEFALKRTLMSFVSSINILSSLYSSSSLTSSSLFSCVSNFTLNVSFSCKMISSTACWMIALFYFCIPNFFLVAGYCLQSLVGPHLSYLVPKLPKTLHSSD